MGAFSGGDLTMSELAAIAKKLKLATKVSCGFPEGSTYDNGTPIATAAAANNYGSPAKGIPPRPFFSNAITEHSKEWGQVLAIELRACQLDTKEALSRTGAHVVGDIAASLIATNGPPLSQVTLLLRQRFPDRQGMTFADVMRARHDVANGIQSTLSGTGAKPLVWTGKMLNHLQGPQAYEVT